MGKKKNKEKETAHKINQELKIKDLQNMAQKLPQKKIFIKEIYIRQQINKQFLIQQLRHDNFEHNNLIINKSQ